MIFVSYVLMLLGIIRQTKQAFWGASVQTKQVDVLVPDVRLEFTMTNVQYITLMAF